MNHLNQLLSENPQAKSYYLSLSEQEQAILMQSSDAVRSLSDMKQVIYRSNTNPSADANDAE